MQETKSYDRPTKGCPSFSSVAALIRLKRIGTAYHVHSRFITTAKQVLTTAAKHAGYSLHISKVFIKSLTEDQNDAGSSKAKLNATHADKPIRECSVKCTVAQIWVKIMCWLTPPDTIQSHMRYGIIIPGA